MVVAKRDYHYQALTARELGALPASLQRLYRRCYAQPPWAASEEHLAAFPHRLADHLDQAGTHGIVVTDTIELTGAIYGWPAPAHRPDDPLTNAGYAAVPPDQQHRLSPPAAVVAELMIHPDHQGTGIGRELLRQFTTQHPAAWLCTHPDSTAAALCTSAGWQQLARFTSPTGAPRLLYAWPAEDERGHHDPTTVTQPSGGTA
jgi:GNAT superfamily N-acetyltransferase